MPALKALSINEGGHPVTHCPNGGPGTGWHIATADEGSPS